MCKNNPSKLAFRWITRLENERKKRGAALLYSQQLLSFCSRQLSRLYEKQNLARVSTFRLAGFNIPSDPYYETYYTKFNVLCKFNVQFLFVVSLAGGIGVLLAFHTLILLLLPEV